MKKILIKPLLFITILLLIILLPVKTSAQDANVNVRVNAPEYVSGTFEVTIDIENVNNLDTGQFDLSFDPGVINVIEVEPGNIENIDVPVDMWRLIDDNTIRVLINLPGMDSVSGSGYLTKIVFEVVGDIGDTSILDLSDTNQKTKRKLARIIDPEQKDVGYEMINVNWFNGNVEVGNSASTTVPVVDRTPTPSVTATSIQSTISDPDPVQTGTHNIGEPGDPRTQINFDYIMVYSFIGLIAFICTLKLLR